MKKSNVGTNIKKALRRIGIEEVPGYGCSEYADMLDRHSVAWCRENQDKITDRLFQMAKKQGSFVFRWQISVFVKSVLLFSKNENY